MGGDKTVVVDVDREGGLNESNSLSAGAGDLGGGGRVDWAINSIDGDGVVASIGGKVGSSEGDGITSLDGTVSWRNLSDRGGQVCLVFDGGREGLLKGIVNVDSNVAGISITVVVDSLNSGEFDLTEGAASG